jgi:hypothetical protein
MALMLLDPVTAGNLHSVGVCAMLLWAEMVG